MTYLFLFILSTFDCSGEEQRTDQQMLPSQIEIETSMSCEGVQSDSMDSTAAGESLVARNGNQGCGSWHGGVCGCGGSRLLCCDGTLSPSCGC